jgi:hypothetical protein
MTAWSDGQTGITQILQVEYPAIDPNSRHVPSTDPTQ